jgi:hypothetical protein
MGDPEMSGESGGRCERAISTVNNYAPSGVTQQEIVATGWSAVCILPTISSR